ncbi:MAG: prolyl oligopeptidase family serine peptidase [Thermoleophilia bacterium]|nr:prolyl oligopeptidase family serine peptidase [Thermoleophilia bacterium]
MADATIDDITDDLGPHYEPFGWHHWPEYPWMSYQFRRVLGETQEGGGAVSECFQVASRMVPGDEESWYEEWLRVADRNRVRGDDSEHDGHIKTARSCWLRAADYYRSAEFWLDPDDPRRLAAFDRCEEVSQKAGKYLDLPLETVKIPYEEDSHLDAYFIPSPYAEPDSDGRQPTLIAFGGLDSFKDELLFMVGNAALERGISCLLVDGPGQGGTLRRQGIANRPDYEVPVGRCIDYLETREDVDPKRIAVCGSSLGGYYAARSASYEHRLAAAISHGAIWSIDDLWHGAGEDHGLAGHIKWVFGVETMAKARERWQPFALEGHLGNMECPYLIVHGGHDVLGVEGATKVYDHARENGVDVTLDLIQAEETGAEHCQHDNPSIGQERVTDWLADRFGIDQNGLAHV